MRVEDHGTDLDSRVWLEELVKILQSLVEMLKQNESLLDSICARAWALLAFSHDRLGNTERALNAYNRAIVADPNRDALLIARGILQYDKSPESLADFQTAFRLDTRYVWPIFYLAHHLFINNQFNDCIRMCERALDMNATSSVKADLLEWIAIAKCEMGYPTQLARGV